MGLTLHGVGASPGIAIGKACVMRRGHVEMPRLVVLEIDQVGRETERFEEALRQTQEEFLRTRERIESSSVEQYVHLLDAHIGILRYPDFIAEVRRRIQRDRLNAEWALTKAINAIRTELLASEDSFLRSRVADLDLLSERVLGYLSGMLPDNLGDVRHRPIVVAGDLRPDDTAQLNRSLVQAFATDGGGRTCQAAIVARSLGIPAVVGLERITEAVETGDILILDGRTGEVMVNPDPDVLAEYRDHQSRYLAADRALVEQAQAAARTRDEYRIPVRANIEMVDGVIHALDRGAEGIGLLRTEFLYTDRPRLPTEEEQYEVYRSAVARSAPHPVTIRTVDLGADTPFSPLRVPSRVSRALGLRGIRFSLKEPDLFREQLAAILRAGAHGEVRLLLPMVSSIDEVRQAKLLLSEVRHELAARRETFDPDVAVGVMIEVPGAAVIADMLAHEVDFVTIGTNDLIHYVLAADRDDLEVSYLYQPLHPAVLRTIATIVNSVHHAGKPVVVCGEMAGEAAHIPILLGLGVDELSMNATAIPRIKYALHLMRMYETKALADQLLTLPTASEVRQFAADHLRLPTTPELWPEEAPTPL